MPCCQSLHASALTLASGHGMRHAGRRCRWEGPQLTEAARSLALIGQDLEVQLKLLAKASFGGWGDSFEFRRYITKDSFEDEQADLMNWNMHLASMCLGGGDESGSGSRGEIVTV